jgi:AmmeMemoRadiSam system protein B
LPGLEIESDQDLAHRLASAIDRLELDASPHHEEHSIEVQLPLLARVAPMTKVVGITIGEGDLDSCLAFAEQLAAVLRDEADRPLLIISTDLNHYAPDPENRRLDGIALEALQQLDPAGLYHTVRENDISMCGLLPTVIVLKTLQNLDALHRCSQIAYGTSADTGGSIDRVVGYAGYLFN